ncbi:MAG: ankyrin repeat domain-containing protein, partial [Bacteroidota bacterium]
GYIQRLKHYKTSPFPRRWLEKAKALELELRIRSKISYLHSPLATTPMAIGFLKPVVLFPAKVLSGLSDQQIEGILIHELAHIKRNDYLVNLLQSLVEILFFYHPAVWWMSAAIRHERENCCDDIAIGLIGETSEYAKTLILLQEQQLHAGVPAVAFTGIRQSFSHRVKRLFNQPTRFADFKEGFVTALILIAGIFALSFSSANVFGSEAQQTAFELPEQLSVPPMEASYEPEQNTVANETAPLLPETEALATPMPAQLDEPQAAQDLFEEATEAIIVPTEATSQPANHPEVITGNKELTLLLRAIDDGDLEMVAFIIEKGVDVNGQTRSGWTPLLEAVDEGKLSIVQLLVDKGANVNLYNKNGWTPLMEAADEGHPQIVQLLIENGADVNAKDRGGQTAIFIATDEGHTEIVTLLLQNGANLEASPQGTHHPLIEAADEGQSDMVELLIKNGADVNTKGEGGWTPLIAAAD